MAQSISDTITRAIQKNNSLLCVGLDPVLSKLPASFHADSTPFFSFNKLIIDATHSFVCGYKPNSAFYEARGTKGLEELAETCQYIREKYPELMIILDAKRADIGNTNNGYVEYAFDYLNVDAVTLHPYLGREALQPFLDRTDKGSIILCRTSNPGAGELQDLQVDGQPLYLHIAEQVVKSWNHNNNCLLVVGATYPEEMKKIRAVAPELNFLVPGIGAQGGDLKKTLQSGLRADKAGLIIAAGRSVIYADDPAEEARKLHEEINSYRRS